MSSNATAAERELMRAVNDAWQRGNWPPERIERLFSSFGIGAKVVSNQLQINDQDLETALRSRWHIIARLEPSSAIVDPQQSSTARKIDWNGVGLVGVLVLFLAVLSGVGYSFYDSYTHTKDYLWPKMTVDEKIKWDQNALAAVEKEIEEGGARILNGESYIRNSRQFTDWIQPKYDKQAEIQAELKELWEQRDKAFVTKTAESEGL